MTPAQVTPNRQNYVAIGKIKENLVTEVVFPCPDLGDGTGAYTVVFQRPKERAPYPVVSRTEWPNVIWEVGVSDTAKPGTGKAEVRWYGDGDKVGKSKTYVVTVTDGLADPTEAPEAYAGYVAQVVRNAEDAKSAASGAETSAGKAEAALKALEDGIASGDFRGEKGEKGDTGPKGEKGDKGDQGPAGDTTAANDAAKAAQAAAVEAQSAAEASAGSAASAAESVGGFAGELAETKAALAAAQKDLAKAQRAIRLQAKLTQGQVWDFEADEQAAYKRTVPSGAHAGAVMQYDGKTVPSDGALVSAEVDTVVSNGKNLVNPDEAAITGMRNVIITKSEIILTDTCRVEIPLSLDVNAVVSIAFGVNAASANSEIGFVLAEGGKIILWGSYNGSAVNNVEKGITKTITKRIIALYVQSWIGSKNVIYSRLQVELSDAPTAYSPYHQTTCTIPAAVRTLPGYGWSAGSVANTVERTEDGWQYVQRVGSRAYQDGDELADGTTTYYELATPITTDITALMGDALDPFDVEPGGTITFHFPAADDGFELDVSAKIQYITKLSEVTADA